MTGPPDRDAPAGSGDDGTSNADGALGVDSYELEVIPVQRRSLKLRIVLGVVALVVALAFVIRPLVITTPAPTSEPAPTALAPTPLPIVESGDRIAMIAPDGSLSIVDRDGALVRRYPVDATVFRFPAFSPDGSRLAVVGGAVDRSGVFVFDVGPSPGSPDAQPPRAVYSSGEHGVIYFAWSPDGETVGFLTGELDTLALRVVGADGLGIDRVVARGQPIYWDWFDDSSLLVHSGGSGPEAFLGSLEPDGTLVSGASRVPGAFQAPGISHDGRHVAFVTLDSDGRTVLALEARGGHGRTAISVGRAASFGWSPVADDLAFIDGGGAAGLGLGALQIAEASTGDARMILDEAVAAFFWSPDGTMIAALAIRPADAGNVASIAAIPGFETRLVVVRAATGERVLERSVALGDLFEQQLLPFFDQYAKSHRLWSADSSAVVLPLVDAEGGSHLTVIPMDGGAAVDLGPGVLGFWSP